MSDLPVQANFIYIERFVQDCQAAACSSGVSGNTNTLVQCLRDILTCTLLLHQCQFTALPMPFRNSYHCHSAPPPMATRMSLISCPRFPAMSPPLQMSFPRTRESRVGSGGLRRHMNNPRIGAGVVPVLSHRGDTAPERCDRISYMVLRGIGPRDDVTLLAGVCRLPV
jgi:hypothetical protein